VTSAAVVAYTVYPDGGEPYVAELTSRLVLLWERTHNGSAAELLDGENVGTWYRICWFHAQTRRGYAGTLEDFEGAHDLLPLAEDQDGAPGPLDPTQPAASTGSA
jgi:hypothetical protein